jgi:hypothetical protein
MADEIHKTEADAAPVRSWREIEEDERRDELGDRDSEIVGELPGAVPSIIPDVLEEDYFADERRANWPKGGWPQREDTAAGRGLIVAALLAFVAVAALLGVAFAV